MRKQIIDPELRFACTDCGDCCIKPWRVPVEEDKIEAIRNFDWGAKYPRLANRNIIETEDSSGVPRHVFSKADDGSCIFYNHEKQNCNLHAELGFEAKPQTCRQYPFMAAPAPDGDRVYAVFSCEGVRIQNGPPLHEQQESIERIIKPTPGWKRTDVQLTYSRTVSIDTSNRLAERLVGYFAADAPGSVWDRFLECLSLLIAVGRTADGEEDAAIADPELGRDVTLPSLNAYASLREAPLTPRVLLGVNLWSDFFPPDSLGRKMSFRQRMSMIMKLMQLVQFRGTYASRLLERNVRLRDLDQPDIIAPVPREATHLIRRWLRSSLIARSFSVNDLSLFAGLHELILDFNAVVFMARALAADSGRPPTDDMYNTAVTRIVSHVSAQRRWYRVLFPSWMLANLDSPQSAWASLRLLYPDVEAQQTSLPAAASTDSHAFRE